MGILVAAVPMSTQAINVSQGYHSSDKSIGVGMAVSLSLDGSDSTTNVELSKRSNLERFVGIVTTVDDTLLAFPKKNSELLVANSGEVNAFMSDVNGQIHKGDLLTISPLEGMLMKASDNDAFIVGSATQDTTSQVDTKEVQTSNNTTKTVVISLDKINLQPRFRQVSLKTDAAGSTFIAFGQSLTGHKVNNAQVLAALAIFFVMLVIEGSIIYGAVQTSLTAIGRNPLSKRAIYKQLLQVSWLSLLIFAFGIGTIFLILWI